MWIGSFSIVFGSWGHNIIPFWNGTVIHLPKLVMSVVISDEYMYLIALLRCIGDASSAVMIVGLLGSEW